jgi:feruloyl esterase
MRKIAWRWSGIGVLAFAVLLARGQRDSGRSALCAALGNVHWKGTTITSAQRVPAGPFTSPGTPPVGDVPAYCRISLVSKPTPGSNIGIELWMPEENWNGEFLGTGNGGGGGKVWQWLLALGLRRGYATANTDLGTSPTAEMAVDQPEKWTDFGYRATHEMTTIGKALVQQYYKKQPKRSYFLGCSTGGQQGLMEAQRYPSDYDGIVAGAPANNRTHLHAALLWNYVATHQSADSVLPPDKIALVTRTVIASCGGKDGGAPDDNFLTDPRLCRFDPDVIPQCRESNDGNCLTAEQAISLRKIYSGPTNPRTGERIYASLPFGSENSALGIAYQEDSAELPKKQFYQYVWVFGPDAVFTKFDFDHDQDKIDLRLAPILNANNPDLDRFRRLGGKLLMFTGTADPIVPFPDALNFYERVVEAQSTTGKGAVRPGPEEALRRTQDFFRYFLVPGMGHCGNGPGLNDLGQWLSFDVSHDNTHDILSALVKWVEEDRPPNEIIATSFGGGDAKKGIRFQRSVCPYPMFPEYVSGDPEVPSSYHCVRHPRDEVPRPADKYLRPTATNDTAAQRTRTESTAKTSH